MFAVLSLMSVGPEKDTKRYEPSPVSSESFVGFRAVTGWMGHLLCFFVLVPSETCKKLTLLTSAFCIISNSYHDVSVYYASPAYMPYNHYFS